MNKINFTNSYFLESAPEKEVFDFIHANGAVLFDDDVFNFYYRNYRKSYLSLYRKIL